MRILLVLVGLVAIAVVLWASWRIDRRLFIFTLIAVLIGALMFGLGVWHSRDQAMVQVSPDDVTLTLEQSRSMEIGVRLQGRVNNGSPHPLARVEARALLERCVDDVCETLGEDRLTLRQHVPPGASLPWSQMVQPPPGTVDGPHDWRLEIKSVSGYANDRRRRP
ncbi:hypothetical protein [Isoalcanivorax indicus]|uniref:hypothetical protein n=1 Tax=Isoalcanivorax indicus TaxID=2202653 RepID=UPI000DBA5829|nr:hypothetical protein [Isoalcanivorax indicus]